MNNLTRNFCDYGDKKCQLYMSKLQKGHEANYTRPTLVCIINTVCCVVITQS